MASNDGAIQTYSGRIVRPASMTARDVVLDDIIYPLCQQCRFAGHCHKFWSVGDHSLLVSLLCSAKYRLEALFHDASEAYLVDIPAPLKRLPEFSGYLAIEKRVESAIAERFGLVYPWPDEVKWADARALVIEARHIMAPLAPGMWDLGEPLTDHEEAAFQYLVTRSSRYSIEARLAVEARERRAV